MKGTLIISTVQSVDPYDFHALRFHFYNNGIKKIHSFFEEDELADENEVENEDEDDCKIAYCNGGNQLVKTLVTNLLFVWIMIVFMLFVIVDTGAYVTFVTKNWMRK